MPLVIENCGEHVATCTVQFGADRPGLFVSNADAIIWAADLRELVIMAHNAAWPRKKKIYELVELLESVK